MERPLVQELEYLSQGIAACVEHWKLDNDAQGYEHFIQVIERLAHLMQYYPDEVEGQTVQLLSIADGLHLRVVNKDVIGICDLLEFDLLPLIKAWIKGEEQHDMV